MATSKYVDPQGRIAYHVYGKNPDGSGSEAKGGYIYWDQLDGPTWGGVGACAMQTMIRDSSLGWMLLDCPDHARFRRTSHRLDHPTYIVDEARLVQRTPTEARRWFKRNGLDLPPELATLATDGSARTTAAAPLPASQPQSPVPASVDDKPVDGPGAMTWSDGQTTYQFNRRQQVLYDLWTVLVKRKLLYTRNELRKRVPRWNDSSTTDATIDRQVKNLREFWRDHGRADIAKKIVGGRTVGFDVPTG